MRKSFKPTKLAAALVAAIAGGSLATPASANVSLTTDGFGDAGIMQYYTVAGDTDSGNWQTMFRLFNNSADAVAVKVRFREGLESREVLDFVVWLSPFDAWSAWTTINASGEGAAVPGIRSRDMSCTTPHPRQGPQSETFGWVDNEVNGTRYAEFKLSSFASGDSEAARAASTRIREGHFEVIGMASFGPNTAVYQQSLHQEVGGNMQPLGCQSLDRFAFGEPVGNIAGDLAAAEDVGNVLATNAFIVRLSTGQGAAYEPVMLGNFATGDDQAEYMLEQQLAHPQLPDLDSGDTDSYYLNVDDQVALTDDWADWNISTGTATDKRLTGLRDFYNSGVVPARVRGGVDAVSATLQRTAVVNEWTRRPVTDSAYLRSIFTQWVLTFPTMHYYTDDTATAGVVASPFADPTLAINTAPFPPFDGSASVGTDPEIPQNYTLTLWNAEEEGVTWTSPIPGEIDPMVREVNVINFGEPTDGNMMLGLYGDDQIQVEENQLPENPKYEPAGNPNADMGWAKLQFYGVNWSQELVGENWTYYGLPVTGFGFTLYQTEGGNQGNAAIGYSHKYERDYEQTTTTP